jgi:hypothetical protein
LEEQKDFCPKPGVTVDIQVSALRSCNLILNSNSFSHVLHKGSWHGNSIPSATQILSFAILFPTIGIRASFIESMVKN